MATAEEGGVTAITNSSSYGGGGAGGKLRKKAFRRQATPYDRPPTVVRGIDRNSGGWLTKIFVDPARKLLSHGVDRFFASVFRKRLAAPVPQRQPEVNKCLSDATQRQVPNGEETREQLVGGECSHLDNGSTGSKISDLEHLVKQNTFTRPEIVRLTELLQYKAAEVSSDDFSKERVGMAVDFGRQGQFSSPAGENMKEIHLSASISTPVHQSKVLGDDAGSPVEIAKAYMESRASKAFPTALGFPHHLAREGMGHPANGSLASSAKNNSASISMVENGSATLNFGGRSAIYNMARNPYSRDNSIFKVGTRLQSQLPSTSSTPRLVEDGEIYGSRSTNLKRRISVLDDEIGSIGPIRRIRQKSNLLASRGPHAISGIVRSRTEQKPELIGDLSNKDSRNVVKNGIYNDPSTSYTHVPSQSSEVAAKILQQLEKLSPKEKSSESKSHFGLEKSNLQLTPNMLSKRALRSMERVDSPILSLEMHVDKKSGEMQSNFLPDSHDSLQKQEIEGSGPREPAFPSETKSSDGNSNLSLKSISSLGGKKTEDSIVANGTFEPSQKNRAFRISVQEDFLELDEDTPEASSKPLIENPETEDPSTIVNKVLPSKETIHLKTESQTELALPKALNANKVNESSIPSVSGNGERGSVSLIEKEAATATSLSEVPPVSAEKLKEVNGPSQTFSFISKVDDTSPTLPSYSTKESASKLECSSSLTTTLPLPGSREKKLEVEEACHLIHIGAGDAKGNSDRTSAANESPVSLPLSVGAAFSSDTAQKPVGTSFLNSNVVSSGVSTPFGDSTSVPASNSSSSSVNLLKVSPEPTTISQTQGLLENTVSGEPPSALPATGPALASGLFSNLTQSAQTNLQSSIFGDPYKNSASGDGTIAHKGFMFAASSASTPDTSAAVPGNSQGSVTAHANGSIASKKGSEVSFGLSSSSTTTSEPHAGGTAPIFNFGLSSSSTTTTGPHTGGTTSVFSFGLSSSSATTTGSQSGGTTPVFNFGSSPSITGLAIDKITPSSSFPSGPSTFAALNTSGSFSSGTSSIFGWSSAASSTAVNSVSSSSASSNMFASSWQNPNPPVFGTTFAFAPSSTPSVFSSSATASSSSHFSFTSNPSSIPSSTSPLSQPVFGKSIVTGFNSSPGNNDQMIAEDSMAEDPLQSSAPAFPVFGQPSATPSASPSPFGFNAPPLQANPFFSFGQQSQGTPQASGSLEFNASGGGFSLGSGAPDKSRRTVRVSKTRNRKK